MGLNRNSWEEDQNSQHMEERELKRRMIESYKKALESYVEADKMLQDINETYHRKTLYFASQTDMSNY